MFRYTPYLITKTFSKYDALVRQALADGDMEKVAAEEENIVSF